MSHEWKRVKDKSTGHEYSLPEIRVDEKRHRVLDKPALGRDGKPLAPKHKTTLAPSVREESAPVADDQAETGHKATDTQGD